MNETLAPRGRFIRRLRTLPWSAPPPARESHMPRQPHGKPRTRRFGKEMLALSLLGVIAVLVSAQNHDEKKAPAKKVDAALPTGVITPEMWRNAPTGPLTSAEIDQLIAKELAKYKAKPASLTSDEQFLRRV